MAVDRRAELHPDFVETESGTILNAPSLDRMVTARLVLAEGLEPFLYRVRTDQYGCRVGSEISPPESGEGVVIILGDSFSFGSHAPYEETIAGRLAIADRSAPVLNFAVPGSCSFSYPDQLKAYLEKTTTVRPKQLVIGLYVDASMGDIARRKAREKFGPYRVVSGYQVSPATFQGAQSAVGRALFRAEVLARQWSSLYNTLHADSNVQFAVPTPKPDKGDAEAILEALDQIEELSGLDPAQILVHFLPSAHEVLARAKAAPEVPPPSANETFWTELAEKLEGEGYEVVDPRQLVVKEFLESKRYPFTADSHLNGYGFGIVTTRILESLTDGVVEKDS